MTQKSKYLMGSMYVAAGLMHLIRPDIYRPIMPPYLPAHDLLILLSGLAEIGLGLLVMWRRTQTLAALGLIALLVAVFPANLYMAQSRAEIWPNVPAWVLLLRLPLQGVLIYWAYRVANERARSVRS